MERELCGKKRSLEAETGADLGGLKFAKICLI
jgi:hypothetical protein